MQTTQYVTDIVETHGECNKGRGAELCMRGTWDEQYIYLGITWNIWDSYIRNKRNLHYKRQFVIFVPLTLTFERCLAVWCGSVTQSGTVRGLHFEQFVFWRICEFKYLGLLKQFMVYFLQISVMLTLCAITVQKQVFWLLY